jgi:hypothetical protein
MPIAPARKVIPLIVKREQAAWHANFQLIVMATSADARETAAT